MRCLLAVIALVTATAIPIHADPAAQLYNESCAGCHTIGGGESAGPDLIASTKWPHAQLEAAIKRMEDNVGPLTDEQVDSLVALLQAPDVKQRLSPPAQLEPAIVQPKGSPDNGRRLFFGERKLANGGSPCFACHASGGRGGSLAADLTAIHTQRSAPALLASTTKPGFPMMKGAYAQHPVTEAEALDLLAFFEASAGAQPRPERTMPVQVAAVSFAGVMLGAVALVFRSRRAGVRSRLVRKSVSKR